MQVPVTDAAVVGDEFETVGLGSDERYVTDEPDEWNDYAVEEAVPATDADAVEG